jgi:anti-sigma factor RsiW
MTCQETAPALGAYVLGALDPVEQRQVDEHLRACPDCAAELAEFESLPPLLDRVRLEDLEVDPVTPSPGLFDRMAAAAAADAEASRRARRSRRLLAVAALVVVLGAGVGVTSWVTATPGPEAAHSAVSGRVHMSVTASAQSDGTVLDVSVAGVRPSENCQLVIVDRAGTRHEAGAWTATYTGDATFRGWTTVHRSAVSDVVLLGTDGHELVRVRL